MGQYDHKIGKCAGVFLNFMVYLANVIKKKKWIRMAEYLSENS